MDCQTFQKKHAAFVDDTLPGVEMGSMRDHLARCACCARRDADIRRALLLIRNLPALRVSDGFEERLRARIGRERAANVIAARGRVSTALLIRGAVAALLVTAVAFGGSTLRDHTAAVPVLRPAVVTFVPAPSYPAEDPAPAFMASMSTGIPMWPALMLAEEGPLLFAATELQAASFSRVP